jgi:biopolymer transport protein ExbB/TolQ
VDAKMNKPIGQDSSLNISLPMLFQAVGIIGAMVWGYVELNGRISFLEYQVRINEEHIEAIEEDAKESQNAEIPADIRQNEKINVLEKEIERLRSGKRN